MKEVKLFLGSDHAGFEVKEKLKQYLDKGKVKYEDLGAFVLDESDDYPDFAFNVAEAVASIPDGKGILICGSGLGMVIAANKVKGIRAIEAFDSYGAKISREHNNSNILAIRARKFPFEKIKKIVDVWLNTEFSGEERHIRRISKITQYENR